MELGTALSAAPSVTPTGAVYAGLKAVTTSVSTRPALAASESARSTSGPLRPASTPGSYRVMSLDRKSTRLNSSHANISYAVFCLKKNERCLLLRIDPRERRVRHSRRFTRRVASHGIIAHVHFLQLITPNSTVRSSS